MNIDELKSTIEESYALEVFEVEKIKNVYRIKTEKDILCLKVIKYNLPHFLFILSAIKHLQDKGFKKVPDLINNKNGTDYIKLNNCNAYLTEWINARECNYDNPIELAEASKKLAELHNFSEGFVVTENMQPRVYWYKWPEHFAARKNEILDFRMRINNKGKKSMFDYLYIQGMDEELERADRAIHYLANSKYIEKIDKDKLKGGFCHHDYAHHNVLIDSSGDINLIDFDYCILDTGLHDLGSLLIRKMKNGKWDIGAASYILDSYSSIRKINMEDIPILAAFMEFPQDYWQIGLQYYWENQPWEEDFFIKKLKKFYEDKDEKQDFINEFRELRYKS